MEILWILLSLSIVWIAVPKLTTEWIVKQLNSELPNGILMLLEQLGVLFSHVRFVVQAPLLTFAFNISNHAIQSLSIIAFKSTMIITLLHRKKDPSASLLTVG